MPLKNPHRPQILSLQSPSPPNTHEQNHQTKNRTNGHTNFRYHNPSDLLTANHRSTSTRSQRGAPTPAWAPVTL